MLTHKGKPVPPWFVALTLGLVGLGFAFLLWID